MQECMGLTMVYGMGCQWVYGSVVYSGERPLRLFAHCILAELRMEELLVQSLAGRHL